MIADAQGQNGDLWGDVNNDGKVDAADVTTLVNIIMAPNRNNDDNTVNNIKDNPTSQNDNYSVFTDNFTPDPNDTTSVCLDWNHPALEVMRKRSETIGNIRWTPLGEVPKRNGVFTKGVEVTGIPYSSVKELDKFVGQEVSFYTFMSAVNNPKSVLYTENVGKAPYNGKNCAAYYGSVCSMTVNYALGLDRPYGTFMYGTLPQIKRVAQQDLEHAAPGDIVHFLYGHVILITDIIKSNDGKIIYVDILECLGNGAFNKRYRRKVFQERLDKYDHVIYRYMDLAKLAIEPSSFPSIDALLETNATNGNLSLSRGDRVSYSEEEGKVIVNVLSEGYVKLEVYRIAEDGITLMEEIDVNESSDVELSNLPAGSYKVQLVRNDGSASDPVFFEILQTDVSYTNIGNDLDIQFNSKNSIPEYIVFCEKNGGRHFIVDISEEEKQSGHKYIKCEASLASLYLKVFFKGEYGRVSNSIIPLKKNDI